MKKIIVLISCLSLPVLASKESSTLVAKAISDKFIKVELTVDPEHVDKFLRMITFMAENKKVYGFENNTLYIHKNLFDRLVKEQYIFVDRSVYPSKMAYLYTKIGSVVNHEAMIGDAIHKTIYIDRSKIDFN